MKHVPGPVDGGKNSVSDARHRKDFLPAMPTGSIDPVSSCASRYWLDRLRLSVQEVIHHDDVMRSVIIRPWGSIAARDPHSSDARVRKHDAEEGHTLIARRSWDRILVEQSPVGAEVLDEGAGWPIPVLVFGPAPVRQVHVREDRAESAGCRWFGLGVGTRHKELRLRHVAIDRAEEALGAERLEDGFVGRVAETRRQAREWGLEKTRPRCGEEGAAIDEEAVERRARDGGRSGAAAVPVDLAATVGKRSGVIPVVCRPQGRSVLVDGGLNRGEVWPRRLEHRRRNEVPAHNLCTSRANRPDAVPATHQGQSHPEYHNQLRRFHKYVRLVLHGHLLR